ncbi:hypothetical protein [Polyangium mundeleinium]|uniref:Uncharacterized protein n=1 Tax=Polyangium mundeleinium TaxID=2995306 RepID=A0ABT5F5R4_9BACT|nr:hypothetical protein [Polyangium mundeleinium]MDC0748837.1 hypothetical protein [Polyangium mundeleinium]
MTFVEFVLAEFEEDEEERRGADSAADADATGARVARTRRIGRPRAGMRRRAAG